LQKETRRNSAAGSAKPNPPRKLTRAEKKQIAEIIRQAKGDGKAHTAQQTIPYIQMYPDGICKVTGRKYSKTVAFEDINYQLAQADDKTAIFENWCDFLNYFDASVSVQLSFINQGTQRGEAEKAVNIPAQEDAFNSIRTEYRDMLKNQLAKGNNGLVKAKYITFAIEADSVKSYITEKKQIPYMTITTDYSISDQGQIDTRIGTFIELLQHLFFVLISLYLCYGI